MCKFFLAAVSKIGDGSLTPRKHKCGTGIILGYPFQTFDTMAVGYTIILIALKNWQEFAYIR